MRLITKKRMKMPSILILSVGFSTRNAALLLTYSISEDTMNMAMIMMSWIESVNSDSNIKLKLLVGVFKTWTLDH